MNKRTVILRPLAVLMGRITVGTAVAYFVRRPDRDWVAFDLGGVGRVSGL